MQTIRSYRDLQVWQKSMQLAAEAYRISKVLPREEQYRLTSQLLRASTSIAANIAEGHGRGTRKDYARFVRIARGSLSETETILYLALNVGLLEEKAVTTSLQLASEIGRMLNSLLQRLQQDPQEASEC